MLIVLKSRSAASNLNKSQDTIQRTGDKFVARSLLWATAPHIWNITDTSGVDGVTVAARSTDQLAETVFLIEKVRG